VVSALGSGTKVGNPDLLAQIKAAEPIEVAS
jgi:hypothetical protein